MTGTRYPGTVHRVPHLRSPHSGIAFPGCSQRPPPNYVLISMPLRNDPRRRQAEMIQQRPGRLGQPGRGGHADRVDDLRLIPGVEEELDDGRAGEEPQVGGVEQPGGRVLEIAPEQRGDDRVVLDIRYGGDHRATGREESPRSPQDRLGVDQVLQDVAEGDAVEAVRLQRPVAVGHVELEDGVEASGGAGGGLGMALDAVDDPVGTELLERRPQPALGAADVEDGPGAVGDRPQQGRVASGVVIRGWLECHRFGVTSEGRARHRAVIFPPPGPKPAHSG
jgi:hypothetical protein